MASGGSGPTREVAMTTTPPNLPVPAGATADDWCDLPAVDGGMARALTCSGHDPDKGGSAVDGWQNTDGRVDRGISLYDAQDKELTAADARRLAAALLNAADELDRLR
jgi:hypothetical protein